MDSDQFCGSDADMFRGDDLPVEFGDGPGGGGDGKRFVFGGVKAVGGPA